MVAVDSVPSPTQVNSRASMINITTTTNNNNNNSSSDCSSGNDGTTTTIASATSTSTSTKAKATSLASFYRNRAARVLPLFYLAHLCAAPLTLVGFGVPPKHFRESVLRNLFATSTWVSD